MTGKCLFFLREKYLKVTHQRNNVSIDGRTKEVKKPSNQTESINVEDLVPMALEKEIPETKEKYAYTKKKKKSHPPKVRLRCTFISVAVKRRGCFSLLCQVSVRMGTSNSYPYHLSREAHWLAAKLSSGPLLGNDPSGQLPTLRQSSLRHVHLMYTTLH